MTSVAAASAEAGEGGRTTPPLDRARTLLGGYAEMLRRHGERRTEIAEEFDRRTRAATAKLEREREDLATKRNTTIAEAEAEKQSRLAEVRGQLDGQIADIERKRKAVLAGETEQVQAKLARLKKERKDSEWLAETVTEADERAAAALLQAIETIVPASIERLEAIEDAARAAGKKIAGPDASFPAPETAEPLELNPKTLKVSAEQLLTEAQESVDGFGGRGIGGLLGLGKGKAEAKWAELAALLGTARARLEATDTKGRERHTAILEHAVQKQEREKASLRTKFDEKKAKYEKRIADVETAVEQKYGTRLRELQELRDRQIGEIDRLCEEKCGQARSKADAALAELDQWYAGETREASEACDAATDELRREWDARVAEYDELTRDLTTLGAHLGKPWAEDSWDDFPGPPADAEPSPVHVGTLRADLDTLEGGLPSEDTGLRQPATRSFDVPLMLDTDGICSLLLSVGRDGRDTALALMRSVMLRSLAMLPPGKCRFTMFDPVGLGQSFSAFMHLADYSDLLVSGKIWTDPRQMDQRLTDLSEHIENVIQAYLRNEYETIEQYNRQAGEIAEPYRFLVIADFPTNFQEESAKKLAGIVTTGPRCGVHTIILADPRERIPKGIELADIEDSSLVIEQDREAMEDEGKLVLRVRDDGVLRPFPLTIDAEPSDARSTTLLHRLGAHSIEAARVEVPFSTISPRSEQFWTRSSAKDIRIPVGRTGATKKQEISLGIGTAQHALIAGKTGSGKSTLMHAMITSAAAWFSPDEVELYLCDFKAGVEFKTYAERQLPHAKVVSIETDRNFGLSVLQKVDSELVGRGELFRAFNVQNVAGYRDRLTGEVDAEMTKAREVYARTGGNPSMPRILLICDEFQELFTTDDKVAQESTLILDRLVRQGRAFGIHVILGSQTLGGAYSLARTTLGQMAVRVALQCNEQDSMLILGEDNPAARLLTRPGEAIYNDAGGLVENNSHFQVVWMNDRQRDETLDRIRSIAIDSPDFEVGEPIVFEGNKPADVTTSIHLPTMFDEIRAGGTAKPDMAVLGEPMAIKEPTGAVLRREAASNVIIVGQKEESALAMIATSSVSLAMRDTETRFLFIDASRSDEPEHGYLAKLTAALPANARFGLTDEAGQLVGEAHAELEARKAGGAAEHSVYLCIYGLQRCRTLRMSDDFGGGFSFGGDTDDGPPAADPSKQLQEVLDEGPELGIHVIAWCDTAGSLERTLGRSGLNHFDARVLFQMSQGDSITLMDSPSASNLGINNRALLYREQAGLEEVFRPFALPSAKWVRSLD
ncbi:MAG: FtsK/SpoIIIE domain-containing protein [Planctomycetota bacterium]